MEFTKKQEEYLKLFIDFAANHASKKLKRQIKNEMSFNNCTIIDIVRASPEWRTYFVNYWEEKSYSEWQKQYKANLFLFHEREIEFFKDSFMGNYPTKDENMEQLKNSFINAINNKDEVLIKEYSDLDFEELANKFIIVTPDDLNLLVDAITPNLYD